MEIIWVYCILVSIFRCNVINNFVKNSKNFDLISSDIIYFNENYKITRYWESPETSFDKFPNKFSHTGMFYSKSIYKKYKYDENLKISSDSKFLIELSKKKISHIKLNFISVCMYNKGLSTNLSSVTTRIKEDLTYLKECYGSKYLVNYFKKVFYKIPSIFISTKIIIYKKN